MTGEAGRTAVAVLGARPVLPFALSAIPARREDDRIGLILARLDALYDMAATTRIELDTLRQLSVQILQVVRPAEAEAQAPARADSPAVPPAASAASHPLQLRLLGGFEANARGRVVSSWPSKKARLLLAYLALERGRMVPKDVLIELFWPDARAERGSNNLSIAVHQIRSTFAAVDQELSHALIVRQGLYGLDSSLVHADLWELHGRLADARHHLEKNDGAAVRRTLGAAVDLWNGEFLESDPYEEWALEPRRSLATTYLQSLAWLATEASGRADWTSVIDYASRIVQRERCDESGHRWLMLAHWSLGNRSQALQQYRICQEWLRSDLGVDPSEETRRMFARIGGKVA